MTRWVAAALLVGSLGRPKRILSHQERPECIDVAGTPPVFDAAAHPVHQHQRWAVALNFVVDSHTVVVDNRHADARSGRSIPMAHPLLAPIE